jgi:putative endonuclease
MSRHNDLGNTGEAIARAFLEEKGHLILRTNFRFEHNEIDIISLCGDILVFSEIKTRSSLHFGFPEESVDLSKQASIKKVAAAFLWDYPEYIKTRFDVLSLFIQKGILKEILHFEDAFY